MVGARAPFEKDWTVMNRYVFVSFAVEYNNGRRTRFGNVTFEVGNECGGIETPQDVNELEDWAEEYVHRTMGKCASVTIINWKRLEE